MSESRDDAHTVFQFFKTDLRVVQWSRAVQMASWYRIPEVPLKTFLRLIRPVYVKRYGNPAHTGCVNATKRAFYCQLSDSDYAAMVYGNRNNTSVDMELGYFHQYLLGSFPGWSSFRNGEKGAGGLDVAKLDETIRMEVKMQNATMNSDSKKSVVAKLSSWAAASPGRIGYIVLISDDRVPVHKKTPLPHGVQYLLGRDAYALVSGRESCLEDVLASIAGCSREYPSLEALDAAIAAPDAP